MNTIDWIELGIFIVTVAYSSGVLRTVVRIHGKQLDDHEGRLRTLEGKPPRSGATARG